MLTVNDVQCIFSVNPILDHLHYRRVWPMISVCCDNITIKSDVFVEIFKKCCWAFYATHMLSVSILNSYISCTYVLNLYANYNLHRSGKNESLLAVP